MQITSGQQYNVGEKPTVILYIYINRHVQLYIYINRHVGTPEKHYKTRQCNTPSHMVVVIYILKVVNTVQSHYMVLNGFPAGSNLGSTVKCRGEAHRYTVHLYYSPCAATNHTPS